MALVNRDKDASEQKECLSAQLGAVATAATRFVAVIPYPCILQSVRNSAAGVSNAMQVAFEVIRGAGSSGIAMGISNMILQNRSLSGMQGFSGLAAAGSTLLALQAGDVVQVVTSVANGNATDLLIQLVVKKTQDIVAYNSVST